ENAKSINLLISFESNRSAKNTHRCLRLEFWRLAWRFLSGGFAGLSVARILCALLSGGGSGFDLLWRSCGKHCSPLGRDDPRRFSFRLQTPPRDHAYAPPARMRRRIKFVPSRDRATHAIP